jgi:tetratricopeptide (TPR) repeat protein
MWIARSVVHHSWLAVTLGATGVAVALAIAWAVARPSKPVPFTALADVHLALADAYFERGAVDRAEHEYRVVLETPSSHVYWYAMYKLGWIDVDRRRYREAEDGFAAVARGTADDPDSQSLHAVAAMDFVTPYVEIGDVAAAYEVFRHVDRTRALAMLGKLADLYLERGLNVQAIAAYGQLIALAPFDERACTWQYNIAHAELASGDTNTAEAVAQIEKLVRTWTALATTLPAAERQACHDNAAAMSGELARSYHAAAAKTKDAAVLANAVRLYKAYVDAFSDAPDFAATEYFYAEALWATAEAAPTPPAQSKAFADAAVVFLGASKLPSLETKLRHEAAYAAVLGWKNAVNIDPRAAEPDVGSSTREAPIPEPQNKLIEALDNYVAVIGNPDDDTVVGMRFLKASMLRRYHHFDDAIPIFVDILAHHAAHDTAEASANLLLDTYNGLGRTAEMSALATSLLANSSLMRDKPALQKTLRALRTR